YKWTLTGGSTKTTKDTSWVPTTSGTLAVVCTVTDGRGRTATISKNIAVTAYTPPTLKMTRVDRVTVDLNKVDAIYTSTVDAISDTNRWRLVIRTRPVGGDWSTAYDSGVTTNGTSGSKTSRLTPTYAITTAYELEATLTDGYTTRKGSLMIPTESVPLAIGKYGIGVGKVPQGDRVLDVGGEIYADDILLEGESVASHLAESVSDDVHGLAWTDYEELTLLNGWTGSLRVRKNAMGMVSIYGVITPGVTDRGTTIATLASNYRPGRVTALPAQSLTVSVGGIVGLAILTSGNLNIYGNAGDNLGTAVRINYVYKAA
ncbi:MAG TPA: hypothetical protein GXX64_13255, partial [Bacteroidales bacterium]|nr:hypothetical protein [Bacteroidales bacterium]